MALTLAEICGDPSCGLTCSSSQECTTISVCFWGPCCGGSVCAGEFLCYQLNFKLIFFIHLKKPLPCLNQENEGSNYKKLMGRGR